MKKENFELEIDHILIDTNTAEDINIKLLTKIAYLLFEMNSSFNEMKKSLNNIESNLGVVKYGNKFK